MSAFFVGLLGLLALAEAGHDLDNRITPSGLIELCIGGLLLIAAIAYWLLGWDD